jgi:hypothetical protein
MGTSVNGKPPFSPSDVQPIAGTDTFGSGGKNFAPNQGNPSVGAVLLDLLKRIARPVANVAALQATVEADRADGMQIVTLDTYTLWVWKDADATAADANHIEPTDTSAGSGLGRWVSMAVSSGSGQGEEQRLTIDVPLATIQAQTSGVAFNLGAALPANARVSGTELNVIATVTGGTISACHSTVQGGTDAAGSLQGSTDVFTATGTFDTAGSDPYESRGGQQLKMTLTSVGDTLAHATTGHLSVDVFYAIVP